MSLNALVIGAAGGLGSEVARQLVGRGCRTLATVLDEGQSQGLQARLPGLADIGIVDLSRADDIGGALRPMLERAGTLDLVAVCAAISPYGPIETTPLSVLRNVLEINAIADVAVYQAVMPYLRRSKGRMVVVTSMAGKVAFPFVGYYSASKFALEALGDVMRREAAQWGVEIVIVEPGGIRTTMVSEQQRTIAEDKAALSEEVRSLYGGLYDAFESSLRTGYDNATPPAIIAETVVKALFESDPEARYVAGPDSDYICNAARTMSDRDLDRIARLETANDVLVRA